MKVNKWSLENWLCEETHNWVQSTKESLDPIQLRHNKSSRDAIARLEHLLEHQRPLDLVRELHPRILEQVEALRTHEQVRMFSSVVHSELLCTFPLRISNWPDMKIWEERIPNSPETELFHIGPEADSERPSGVGRYSIVVPTNRLKNSHSNPDLRRLDPPRVVFRLPSRLDPLIATYLAEVRPRLLGSDSGRNKTLFVRAKATLRNNIYELQTKWMIRELGLTRPWGVHAYRALVATHVVKNATANPYRVGAALLLDAEQTVRRTYARFRPEDDQLRAHAALALQEEFAL